MQRGECCPFQVIGWSTGMRCDCRLFQVLFRPVGMIHLHLLCDIHATAATCPLGSPPAAGGMPDLLLWRSAQRDAKLAEVKGPRDRLSMQQTAWMAALEGAGLCAEVLKVVEPAAGGRGDRKRKR